MTVARLLQRLLPALALAYLVSTLPGVRDGYVGWLDAGLGNAVLVGATVLCALRGALGPDERRAWTAMATALGLWTAGRLTWLALGAGDAQVPMPSAADALWIAFYPAAYLALVLFVRARIRRFHPSTWLDGLLGATAAAAVAAAALVDPIREATGGSLAVVATTLAYPIGDLLLLALVLGLAGAAGWQLDRALLLVGAGLLLFAAGDAVYLVGSATGDYQPGSIVSASWPLAATTIALGGWAPQREARAVGEGVRLLVVPTICSAFAVAVLVGEQGTGNALPFWLAIATLVAAIARTALTFREVDELAARRAEARTDELTGLPNRRALLRRMREAVAEEPTAALLLVDLDRFKELNDTLGHAAGDALLCAIGPRVQEVLGCGDLLARLGGDEFAVVLPGADRERAAQVAHTLHTALEAPFTVAGIELVVEASVGIAHHPTDASDAAELLRLADVAMYDAKERRTGVEAYDPARDARDSDRLELGGRLRAAIADGELVLRVQPKVDLADGAIRSVEALVRWDHPELGLLPPARFLPVAEQGAIMRLLTDAVLRLALAEAAAWHAAGHPIEIAVNLGAQDLLDARLVARVREHLDEAGLRPAALRLEVTEDTVLHDLERTLPALEELRTLGVGLSLDDFGVGRASLAHLKQLPVDELKLDRSFAAGMMADAADLAIVASTIGLGARLGLTVVVEGVEDQASLDALRRLGCPRAQGYHLGRPVPAAELDLGAARLRAA